MQLVITQTKSVNGIKTASQDESPATKPSVNQRLTNWRNHLTRLESKGTYGDFQEKMTSLGYFSVSLDRL
jgi:hypothetical protein